MSRRIKGDVGKLAGTILQNEVFPLLRDDEVTNAIRYDDTILSYGNKLCIKYKQKHLQKMIRGKLRLLGRFLIEIRKINPSIQDLEDVFDPLRYDNVVEAINVVAGLDEKTGRYRAPATASSLGAVLKQVTRTFIVTCIKEKQKKRKQDTEDFLSLVETELFTTVNTTVTENQLEHRRKKKISLPLTSDINLLNSYLTRNIRACYMDLENEYNYSTWKSLASLTLISIQVFNRRRPGEIERTRIDDFNCYQKIDLNRYQGETEGTSNEYFRFMIRGKRARGVPVIMNSEMLKCIHMILKHRKESSVPDENPFVFGISGSTNYKHLRANDLIRKYAEDCGAKKSGLLRGTLLRKHIATLYAEKNLPDQEVGFLLDHLGHERAIHLEHYRQPVAKRDMQVTEFLEHAQGKQYHRKIKFLLLPKRFLILLLPI